MRVLFFGYSQMGYRAVELLAGRGDEVLSVVTHRDDPDENRWYRTPAEAAAAHGLDVVYGEDLGKDGAAELAERFAPDLVLSVFYRDLLPDRVLAAARLAALNLHPSLLPAYRGRAPINWVLVNGERETGVTLHHMTARADAGDIVAQRAIPIAPRETALTLYHKVEEAGIEILATALPLVAEGRAPRTPQDLARSSYFGRRRPEDGRIDWSWPAERIDRLVRAVAPPGRAPSPRSRGGAPWWRPASRPNRPPCRPAPSAATATASSSPPPTAGTASTPCSSSMQ